MNYECAKSLCDCAPLIPDSCFVIPPHRASRDAARGCGGVIGVDPSESKNSLVSGSRWKAAPKEVIVLYAKTSCLSYYCSRVPQDTNSLGEPARTNWQG